MQNNQRIVMQGEADQEVLIQNFWINFFVKLLDNIYNLLLSFVCINIIAWC